MPLSGTVYCSTVDVSNALTSLNAQGTPNDMSQPLLQLACEQGSAKVSAWTGQVWGFDQAGNVIAVPDIIISLTIDVACYYATLAYRKNKPLDVRDPVQLRYTAALADLKAIQEGQIMASPEQLNQSVVPGGRRINTIPGIFTPYDSGTRLSRGRVEAEQTPGGGGLPGQLGY